MLLKAALLVAVGLCDDSTCETWPVQTLDLNESSAWSRYFATCHQYGVKPSADVLNRLELGFANLIVASTELERFGNLEFRALAKLLEDSDAAYLEQLRSLDLSGCELGPASMYLIAQLLRNPRCKLELLDLSYQDVGLDGLCVLSAALSVSPTLRVLRLHASNVRNSAGQYLVKYLSNSSAHRLEELNIQNNYLEYQVILDFEKVARDQQINIYLGGNNRGDQIWNAVTHGIGEVLVIIGCFLLGMELLHKPSYYKFPIVVYCMSLNVLYVCSTLFHAFFALGHTTVAIFGVLDYTGIFLLIAGSYTPFFGILFYREQWGRNLLRGMWTVAILGILTAAFYSGPGQTAIRLALFLSMGWAAAAYLGRISVALGTRGTALLFAGGIWYTLGVPWFILDGHTLGCCGNVPDHAIWHLFVLAGSISHFLCIYLYVVQREIPEEFLRELEPTASDDSSSEREPNTKERRVSRSSRLSSRCYR